MRVWRMSLRRTKSTIISWHGSYKVSLFTMAHIIPIGSSSRLVALSCLLIFTTDFLIINYLSRLMTKPTTSAQSDQSSLGAEWVAKDPRFLHADSEDSDLTGRMPRWAHMPFCWFCHEAAHFILEATEQYLTTKHERKLKIKENKLRIFYDCLFFFISWFLLLGTD